MNKHRTLKTLIVNDTRKTLGGGQHPLCARGHIGKQASVDLKKSLESVCCVFRSSFRSLMAKKVRLANNEESHMCVPFASLLTQFPFEVFTVGTFISLKCYAASTFFWNEIFKYLPLDSLLSSLVFGFAWKRMKKTRREKTFIIILILWITFFLFLNPCANAVQGLISFCLCAQELV